MGHGGFCCKQAVTTRRRHMKTDHLPRICDLSVNGKRVLVRVDFNAPVKDGVVLDDSRLRAGLPTIMELIRKKARVICISHLGRPKGQVVESLSLAPVAARLAELLSETLDDPDFELKFADDVIGDGPRRLIRDMEPGELILLENLRFHPGEKSNDPDFAIALADNIDIYVNDAFGTAHRAHASTVGVLSLVDTVAIGLLMEQELQVLDRIRHDPDRPYIAVLGGAKVSDKIEVIQTLMSEVQGLVIGGAMANTFLAASGYNVGRSLVEHDQTNIAKHIMDVAKRKNISLVLPVDVVCAHEMDADEAKTCDVSDVSKDMMILDIGPKTVQKMAALLRSAETVFWNGPMGVFEKPLFAEGTNSIAKIIAGLKTFAVVGGGDSLAAVAQAGLSDQMSHCSTGGGASLKLLEGADLVALTQLGFAADKITASRPST